MVVCVMQNKVPYYQNYRDKSNWSVAANPSSALFPNTCAHELRVW